jgi:photosystem II stability/assembly factor-like uncharacterized protein
MLLAPAASYGAHGHHAMAASRHRVSNRAHALGSMHRRQTGGHPGSSPFLSLGSWQYIGPNQYSDHYETAYGLGAMSGRVNAVAVDPTNPLRIYAGAAGGGVWRSLDGGQTWTLITPGLPHLQISSLAIDPAHPNRLYVGTGDPDNTDASQATYPCGVYMSTNATQAVTASSGPTFVHLGDATIDTLTVSKLLVNPDNSGQILAATRLGATGYGYLYTYNFSNGSTANTWTAALPVAGIWSDVEAGQKDSTGTRYLYASATFSAGVGNGTYLGGIWASTDGNRWVKLGTPSRLSSSPWRLAVAPSTINDAAHWRRVYFASPFDSKIYQSNDGGKTWGDITASLPPTDLAGQPVWANSPHSFFLKSGVLVNGKTKSDMLMLGLNDIYQLNEGGAWTNVNETFTGSDLVHYDQHDAAFNPSSGSNSLYVANAGGVYSLAYSPATSSWTPNSLNGNLPIGQANGASYDALNPTIAAAGLDENGTAVWNLLSSVTPWAMITGGSTILGGSGGPPLIRPYNPDGLEVVYSSSIGPLAPNGANVLSVYRNGVDTGLSNLDAADVIGHNAPITIDPNNVDLVYTATNFLYVWDDTMALWSKVSPSLSAGSYVTTIKVAVGDDNRILTGSQDGQLWMTTDGGYTWAQVPIATIKPSGPIRAIDIDPGNENHVIIGLGISTGTTLYETQNITAATPVWTAATGATGGLFSNLLPQIPVNSIARDPDFSTGANATLYVGTDAGVYYSSDAGKDWFKGPAGLPSVVVRDVQAIGGTRYLNAATFGLGIARYSLDNMGGFVSFSLAPTTVAGSATVTGALQYNGDTRTTTTVKLTSSNTKAATVPATLTVPAGTAWITFPITTLPVNARTPVTISIAGPGYSASASLTVTPPVGLTTFTINPTTLEAGQWAQGTVTITSPAPSNGTLVMLSCTDPNVVQVPGAVTIPAGQTSTTFVVKSTGSSVAENVTVTASYNGTTQAVVLSITPIGFTGLSLKPNTVLNGYTSTGTVTINVGAPPAGAIIALSSSNPAVASVPKNVEIGFGNNSVTFTVNTYNVSASTQVTITGTYAGATQNPVTQSAVLTVNPIALTSITLSTDVNGKPGTAVYGQTVVGTATIASPAPPSGAVVTLAASPTGLVSIPSSVTIPAGATSANFPVKLITQVTKATTVLIQGSYDGVPAADSFTINPLTIANIAFLPDTVVGTRATTGTVMLNGVTPVALTITLSLSNPATMQPYLTTNFPLTVTIPAGSNSATFSVLTNNTINGPGQPQVFPITVTGALVGLGSGGSGTFYVSP